MTDEQDQPRHRSSIGEVFQRVHKVENDLSELRTDLASVAQIVKGQDATLSRIATGLEQRQQTDWKALASWATVILAVGGLFASLTLAPMRTQMDAQQRSIERLADFRVDDARRSLQDAEERGRYKERVDILLQDRQQPQASHR